MDRVFSLAEIGQFVTPNALSCRCNRFRLEPVELTDELVYRVISIDDGALHGYLSADRLEKILNAKRGIVDNYAAVTIPMDAQLRLYRDAMREGLPFDARAAAREMERLAAQAVMLAEVQVSARLGIEEAGE